MHKVRISAFFIWGTSSLVFDNAIVNDKIKITVEENLSFFKGLKWTAYMYEI